MELEWIYYGFSDRIGNLIVYISLRSSSESGEGGITMVVIIVTSIREVMVLMVVM